MRKEIFLSYAGGEGNDYIVGTIFYQVEGNPSIPGVKVFLDEMPEAEQQPGKLPQLHVDPATKRMWYEYLDRPLTDAEKVEELETKSAQLEAELIELRDSTNADKLEAAKANTELFELIVTMTGG